MARPGADRGALDRLGGPAGDWRFEWSLLGSDGDLAFVQGRTTYLDDRPSYENLWVVRLDADGRASGFTEWFMERKV